MIDITSIIGPMLTHRWFVSNLAIRFFSALLQRPHCEQLVSPMLPERFHVSLSGSTRDTERSQGSGTCSDPVTSENGKSLRMLCENVILPHKSLWLAVVADVEVLRAFPFPLEVFRQGSFKEER